MEHQVGHQPHSRPGAHLGYRLLRIARGDTTPLPGFDQNAYIASTDLDPVPSPSIEGSLQRRTNLLCFEALDDEELARTEAVIDLPETARALLFVMAGHVMHHIESLAIDYNVGG